MTTTDHFLPYQRRWIDDPAPLRICEKSRQIGLTYADAYDSVLKAADITDGKDVWVSSRDEDTARLYLGHCRRWAKVLNHVAEDLGQIIIDSKRDITARVLRFPRGFSIYCLSSNPNALVGRSGHIKIDEFAVHQDQRELYSIASPCINWGGQLSIISTHRAVDTTFNQIIRSIREEGNPMGWSHHRITIHDAVEQGIVERINAATHRNESRGAFLQRLRSQCLDEEQWLREYCCQPSDENSAFITWEMITSCEYPNCLKPFSYLSDGCEPEDPGYHPTHPSHWSQPSHSSNFDPHLTHLTHATHPLYVGVDVARKHDLTVIDVGEKIGDVLWDRMRIELHNKKFSEIEHELFRILRLRSVKRCCIDATGIGMQLAERAKERFRYKVEPITFTAPLKEDLAFALRRAFEDRALRIDPDPKLRADLRAIKKTVTSAGNIRFLCEDEVGRDGPSAPSHADRFWAKALRQHAASRKKAKVGAMVVHDHWDSGWSALHQQRGHRLHPLPLLKMKSSSSSFSRGAGISPAGSGGVLPPSVFARHTSHSSHHSHLWNLSKIPIRSGELGTSLCIRHWPFRYPPSGAGVCASRRAPRATGGHAVNGNAWHGSVCHYSSQKKKGMTMDAKCCRCDARACGVALARWVIGVVLLFAGIAKFPNVSGFVTYVTSQFEKTWLPKALLVPYAYALPFAEVALGALLLLGIARNAVLFITGLLFVTLTFGQLLLSQPIVFQNAMYTVVTAAILFGEQYDRCVLPLGNRRTATAQPVTPQPV